MADMKYALFLKHYLKYNRFDLVVTEAYVRQKQEQKSLNNKKGSVTVLVQSSQNITLLTNENI